MPLDYKENSQLDGERKAALTASLLSRDCLLFFVRLKQAISFASSTARMATGGKQSSLPRASAVTSLPTTWHRRRYGASHCFVAMDLCKCFHPFLSGMPVSFPWLLLSLSGGLCSFPPVFVSHLGHIIILYFSFAVLPLPRPNFLSFYMFCVSSTLSPCPSRGF